MTAHPTPAGTPVPGTGNPFASGVDVPWCNGCSYTQLNAKIQDALARRYAPRQVVLVSDIGCIGIVDKLYACDTVHSLHGRSVALAAGIKLAHADPGLKVIVFIGDGGCSIGLQHLLEAARLNVPLTVFAFDNQNYGMTGGQHSTFTLPQVKTVTTPHGSAVPANDLVRLLEGFPGAFRARLTANDARVPDAIAQALAHPGFAYLETLNFCSSYVGRTNPELALSRAQAYCESFGRAFGVFPGGPGTPFAWHTTTAEPAPPPRGEAVRFAHALAAPVRIVVGGSAGGGVQTAATLFTQAAVLCGLHVSQKSDFPVTVGKGHSTSELILSPDPILFAGISRPDLAIVCTEDGRRALAGLIPAAGAVVSQTGLAVERGDAVDFQVHGKRSAAFYALALMLRREGWFPPEALREAVAGLDNAPRREALLNILDAGPDAGGGQAGTGAA